MPDAPTDLSLATVCLTGPLEERLAAAAHAGFDGIELFEPDRAASGLSPAEVHKHCTDLGLKIVAHQPFHDFEALPLELHATNMRRLDRAFDLMSELDCDLLLMCSSESPHTIDDVGLAVEQLHTAAVEAAARGMRIAYEALAWGRYVNTWQQSWEIVRSVDHPALGVCLDSFHIYATGSDISGIADVPGDKIFLYQIADADYLDLPPKQWSRHHRKLPGAGTFDLTALTAAVRGAGYTGPLSLEVFTDDTGTGPDRAAVEAFRPLAALEPRPS
ncbi:sugar phosphate isomerase/epimerase family protein [Rhodococcus chondri]|uniref:Sugar phosphate isomerase/epimerase family protein n=1 Tax=Rhodococcus chondri TaxID=3065941 RepID=A0ABU7JKK1_9NOCA|nr:sugar phosphate isomerase/epimerase family protein [Rhodococcus sp. CC-R104]MEE2030571.1 sugar phosphate isomerase/epimerase family protein [Rhodococcus sp. CC-R104]